MRASLWNRSSFSGSPSQQGGQELEGDGLAELQVVGPVHLAHAAPAQEADDAVPVEQQVTGREALAAAPTRPPRPG